MGGDFSSFAPKTIFGLFIKISQADRRNTMKLLVQENWFKTVFTAPNTEHVLGEGGGFFNWICDNLAIFKLSSKLIFLRPTS